MCVSCVGKKLLLLQVPKACELLRLVDMGKISRVLVVRIHIVLSVSCYCLVCLYHCVASRESWPSHSLKPCRVLGFVDAYV